MKKYKRKLKTKIQNIVIIFESILSLFIIAGVLIGIRDLTRYLGIIYSAPTGMAYDVLKNFIGHLLLLIIGLELVIMLVKHTPDSLLEVLVFAIARKMVIYTESFLEILMGVLAVGGIFAIRKYLHGRDLEREAEKGILVGAATKVSSLNKALNTFIPEDIAETIGGVVARIAAEKGKKLVPGTTIKIADVGLSIYRMEDGVIEKIKVTRLKELE
ncbi:hypothetical protein BBF96_10725 [Anoxybacter fermentans]|uniref:Transporter-associated domain-containing protein n=1 Tax=Anoxybacter fermentans TaxID=1323375 RepID=A0A3Q9HR93_9FIRM|nr:transporter associated domain-containing protein [Anoxybacter fermentans]AZR73818.1 hypothetical protein BBF96_10725 [Anoxybacter fermentans]